MKRNHIITIIIATLVGFAAACATVALRPVVAQPPVPGQFSECFRAIRVPRAYASDVNAGQMPAQTLRVPSGWTPVGGTETGVILCH